MKNILWPEINSKNKIMNKNNSINEDRKKYKEIKGELWL